MEGSIQSHIEYYEKLATFQKQKGPDPKPNQLLRLQRFQPVTIVSPLLHDGGWFPPSKQQGGGPAAAPVSCNMDNKIQPHALAANRKQEVKLHAMP